MLVTLPSTGAGWRVSLLMLKEASLSLLVPLVMLGAPDTFLLAGVVIAHCGDTRVLGKLDSRVNVKTT